MTELKLRELVADILALDSIDAESSFVELGGDSLMAMKVSARALQEHGMQVSVGDLLGSLAVQDVLKKAQPARVPTRAAATATDSQPSAELSTEGLTRAQQGMWMFQEMMGGTAYNLVFVAKIEGKLQLEVLNSPLVCCWSDTMDCAPISKFRNPV